MKYEFEEGPYPRPFKLKIGALNPWSGRFESLWGVKVLPNSCRIEFWHSNFFWNIKVLTVIFELSKTFLIHLKRTSDQYSSGGLCMSYWLCRLN